MLVHGGGPKGSGLLTKLRKLASVTEVKSQEIKASELTGFVTSEFAAPRRQDRLRRGGLPGHRRSGETCAHSRPLPTS